MIRWVAVIVPNSYVVLNLSALFEYLMRNALKHTTTAQGDVSISTDAKTTNLSIQMFPHVPLNIVISVRRPPFFSPVC